MEASVIAINNKTFDCPRWLLLFATCAGMFAIGLAARDNPAGAQGARTQEEDIVLMPKLEVVAQRRTWQYTRTKHIEFLTDMSSDRVAAELARALDMAVEHAEFIFPNAEKIGEIPIKIIIYEGDSGESDTMTFPQLIRNRKKWRHASNPEQYMIVRPYTKDFLGIMRDRFLNGQWVGQALFGGRRSVIMNPLDELRTRRAYAFNLYMDCVYRALWINAQTRFADSPRHHWDWISEMAGGLFENSKSLGIYYTKREDLAYQSANAQTQISKPFSNYQYKYEPSIAELRWRLGPAVPLEEMLTNSPPPAPHYTGGATLRKTLGVEEPDTYDDPADRVAVKWAIWSRECRDFGSYCLIAKRDKYKDAWMRFVHAIGHHPPTEELFMECFGIGFAAFYSEMYTYLKKLPEAQKMWGWGPLYYTIDIYENRPKPVAPELRPATRAEIARMLSEAMVFGNSDSPEYARNVLIKAATEMPQTLEDPEFAASLGLNEAKHGDRDRAIELLEKATAAKVARASAYRTLAQLRLEKLLAEKHNDSTAKLTAQEAASILDPLLLAHSQRQATGQAYKQMAELWKHTDCDPPDVIFALIAAGCVHFAADLDLLEVAVPLLAKYHKKKEVSVILEHSAKWMFAPADKERHKKLTQQYGPRSNG